MNLRFPYIDMHCDTLSKGFFKKLDDIYQVPEFMFDFDRFVKSDGLLQFTAIFFPPREIPRGEFSVEEMPEDMDYYVGCRDLLKKTIAAHGDKISWVKNMADYQAGKLSGKSMAMLTLEDGRAVQGSMENLENFVKDGVRAIALTWNFINCFGYPNSRDMDIMEKGLTDFGKEAVCAMEEWGVLSDCSHLSDGGFYDLADILKKPFIASHSNARALVDHPRNLKDDQIRILGNKGGVMGLNFCPTFLDMHEPAYSTAEFLAEQAAYIANIGGVDLVAIGTDLDGISGNVEVDSPDKIHLLWDALAKKGFSASDIEKISYKNVERVLGDVLK